MKKELQSLILLLALLVVGTSPSLAYFTYWKYTATAKDNGQETDGGNYTFRYDSEDTKGNFMDFRTHTMFDAQKDMYKWGWYIRANYGSVGNDNITIVTVTLEDGDGYKHDIAEAELVGYQEPKVKWSERPVYFSSLKSSGDFKYMFSLEYQPTETDIEENVKRVFICCKTEWKGGKNVRYFQYERDIDLSSLKESASKYSCEQDDAGNLVFKVSGVPKAAKNSDRYLERYFCGEVLYLGGYNYFKETVKFSLTDANYTGGTDSEANYTFTIPMRWYTMSMRLLHLRYVVEAKRQTQGYKGDDRYSYVMKAVDDDTYNSGILFKPYSRPDKIIVEFDKWNKRNIVQWSRATQVEELMNRPKQSIDCRTDGTWYVLRYEIDREPSSYEVIKEVSGSSTNLKVEDTTIDYDKEYVYRVVFLPQLLKSTFADKLVNLPGEIYDLWEEACVETTMEVPIELAQDRTCDTSVRLVWDYCVKGTGYDWSIDYRPVGETTWRTLNETIPVDINESRASFDASGTVCDLIEYRVKINVAGKDYCSNIVTTNLPTGSYISEVKASTGTEEKTVFVKWKVARADMKNDIYYRVLRRAVGAEEWTLLTDQIHGTASEYTYTDDRPLAGSYYEYTVEAYEAKCADQLIKTDAVIAPGFSQARGTITGHVAFGTGTSVAGARINLIKSAADGSSQDPQFLSRHLEGEGKGLQWRAASDVFAKVFDGGKPLALQLWAKPASDGDSQMALLNIPGALELGVKRIGNTSGYELQMPDSNYMLIGSEDDWVRFASEVNSGRTQLSAIMTADVDLGSKLVMVGNDPDKPYTGTFDGNGHTLRFNPSPYSEAYCAPFRHVGSTTIKNLRVAGSISSSGKFVGGLIAHVSDGAVTNIENCRSSVSVDSRVSGDATNGGFVANGGTGIVKLRNCLFDGSLTGEDSHSCGGMVGWSENVVSIYNTLFAPASVTVKSNSCSTFARMRHNDRLTLTGCYYTNSLGGTVQGTNATDMDSASLLAALGESWLSTGGSLQPVVKSIATPSIPRKPFTVTTVEQGAGTSNDSTALWQLYAVDLTTATPKVKEFPALTFSSTDFTHVAAVYDGASAWTFYVGTDTIGSDGMTVGNKQWTAAEPVMGIGGSNHMSGSAFKGNVDDIRLWNSKLTVKAIETNYTRILGGTEEGLVLYWPLDEGLNVKSYAFDISCQDGIYQLNHPEVGVNALPSTEVPQRLALYGMTDAEGDYIIKGIPFQQGGTNYKLAPELGIHEFSPTTRSMFVSPTSLTANNIDFEDVSSFPMEGYIYYAGTNIPAKDIQLYIDGELVTANGQVATTDDNGHYLISVPIGKHFVQAKQTGHTMVAAGRFPHTGTYDFNRAVTYNFTDSTLVNYVGRVAGGEINDTLAVGFASSKNNIGVATITMKLSNESFSFNCQDDHITAATQNRTFDSDTTAIKSHTWTGFGSDSKYIYIQTDSVTGEFSALLPPLKYLTKNIEVKSNRDIEFINMPEVDLTTVIKSQKDSLTTITANGDSVKSYYTYNTKSVYTYYAPPQLELRQRNNPKGAYGVQELTGVEDDFGTADITDIWHTDEETGEVSYRFQYPVYKMQDKYYYDIRGYEAYTNYDASPVVTDTIPMKAQILSIKNEMTSDQQIAYRVEDPEALGLNVGDVVDLKSDEIMLDAAGRASYSWTCGYPTLVSPYTRHLGINYVRKNRTYVWPGIDGIVLGALPTGNNFVTLGPDRPTQVLRDPPGANSKTTWKTGKTTTKLRTHANGFSGDDKAYVELIWGAELSIGAGLGLMIMSSTKNDVQSKVGVHVLVDKGSSTEETWTTTTTQEVSTNGTPYYVGFNGDVFIGASTNLIFGTCRKVGLFRESASGDYGIRQVDAMSLGDSVRTTFMFSQQEIELNQIPNWKKLRKDLFIHVDTKEEAMNYPADPYEPLYVTWLKEGDAEYGDTATYNWIKPVNTPENCKSDSILWLTNQIRLWEQVLSDNEQDKVEAMKGTEYFSKNISFDSGAPNGYSERLDTTYTRKHNYSYTARAIVGYRSGIGVTSGSKFGANISVETENGGYNSWVESDPNENYKNYAELDYSFADANPATHLSVNVYKSPSGWSDIFSVFGGQTYCPYEGEVRTRYYEKDKHVLSNATVQMDKPTLRISTGDGLPAQSVTLSDVPCGTSALFKLHLSNASDSGSDMYYALAPAEASNTMGLQLLVDGLSLASGRSIMVPAGTTVEKTLEVRQTDISVLDYKDVKLKLTSVCQNAENGFFPPIKDEVSLDVHFKPISSAIDMVIADPILNTDNKEGKLAVRLTNFNRQFQHLKNVGLQYRFEGNTQWINLHTWATDKADTTSAGVSLLPASGDLRYEVDMSDNVSYPEGAYQFRAYTTTPYGDEMVSTYSQVVDVVKDMTRPRNLTTPSPATGILHYGDELSLEFNEDIVPGYVSNKNVIVTAKLNSRQLTHETALQLQPYGDVPVTVNPIFLDGDFAMDFWLRWHDSGTVLQQGDYNPNFALNIDDAGHLVANIAGTKMTSKATLPKDEWIFFALNYKASTMTFDILAQYGDHDIELFKNQPITPTDVQVITNTGDNYIYLGGIHADMHALSLYNISHDVYDAAATKYQAKDNYVYGLANYWPMDEGHGEIAHDTRHTHDFSVTDQWTRDNVNYSVRIDNEQGLKTDITRIGTTPGDSYAIELWQKISSAVNQQTVFETATPTVDGDLLPASAKIRLHYDAAKNLVLDYGTKSQVVASIEDFPDPYVWRHMALNVVRGQAASFYINGQRTAVIAEADVPPLQGTTLLVGRNDDLTYVDELRIWHASLSESRLQNNIYNTIDTADVYARGLAAYYPFEKTGTVNGVTTKVQTMENMAKTALSGKSETITSEGEYMPVKFVPPLKNAPEETRLVASTVASERKVVINLTGAGISPRDIEGTTLNITVDQVHDLHGNTSLPIRWTAYVQQNTLDWTRDSVNIVKMYGDSYTFDVIIENKSGNTEYYTLYNMPQWLTVDGSATSDDIAPLSTKVLRFQVNPLVPVGNYDVTIGLQGNKQILEPLRVVMKVRAETPAWTVDPTQYEHQMTYIGQVRIGGILMENSESLVAAFIDGECRGVASPEKVRGAAYVTMTVYGSGYEGEDLNKPVKFRIWDASTGMAYTDVNCTTHDGSAVDNTFAPDKVNGSYDDPVIWTKGNKVEQLLKLNTMWNWVALGVAPADKRPVAVFPELTEWKTFIKDKNSTMIFSNGVEWRPNNVSIEPATMYKVKIVATKADQKLPEQLPVTGEQLVLSETPVTVKNGWNWIAYTPMTTMSLGQALAGVNPKAGDCVKSQRGIAFYNRMNGWEGSLKALESGHGYMYNSMDTQQKSFCYPEPTAASRMQSPFLATEAPCHIFTPVGGTDYPDNMTMVILLRNGDQTIDTCEVAAFIDNECRGATRANGGLYYLMIAGEGSGQQIEVRTCIDGDIVSIDNNQKYTTDQIIGTPWEPYVIDLSALVTGIADLEPSEEDDADWWTLQGFKIGRRPTRAGVYIHHGKKETVKVRR